MNKNYEQWINNPHIDQETLTILKNMDETSIKECFGKDLEFGTAGLRGLLGVGTNRLNKYSVNKITQGLAKYLLAQYNEDICVAICYDSRHYSKEFSEVCAKTLATYNIKSVVFNDVKPTPLLSYLIRNKHCLAGIMITASHNPKEYNGYKVYNHTGSQLNIDEANEVIKYINSCDDYLDFKYDDSKTNLITYVGQEIEDQYFNDIKDIEINQVSKDLKVVFTPEHGTSYQVMPRCFDFFNYPPLICVLEQMEPNGDFPNTITSNPEDIKAFDKALEYAQKYEADLIIANDPDADRLGIMYKDHNNKFHALSGNQTGTLLIDYITNNKNVKDKLLYKTIVTGEMGSVIAKSRGVIVKELLTGFKFIGEQIALLKDVNQYLFGYEESYGYLIKPVVRDKDAIQAAILIAEMTSYYKDRGLDLGMRLEQLYEEFGYYCEKTYSIEYNQSDGIDIIKNIMKQARDLTINEICNLNISHKYDYLNNIDDLPQADVLKFILDDQGWFVLRPSGTEPKLKIYISIKAKSEMEANELNAALFASIKKLLNIL